MEASLKFSLGIAKIFGSSMSHTRSVPVGIALAATAPFAMYHIQAAALFARQSKALETGEYAGTEQERFVDYMAYVTGTIFSSVAFLEAQIKEVFDAVKRSTGPIPNYLDEPSRARIIYFWNELIKDTSTLQQYEMFLLLSGKDKYAHGESPYQDVSLLIHLRNKLIHYEPIWVAYNATAPVKDMHDLHKDLRGKFPSKDQHNPFARPNAHFLDVYLSHACAKWAVESSKTFVDDFFSKIMPEPKPYEQIRYRLNAE